MDPTHLADEALRRFTALHTSRPGEGTDSAAEALMAAFHHLAKLDAWAKISLDRLIADPLDARAAQELKVSMEQAAGLHPQFTRRLADVLAERAPVAPAIAGTPLPKPMVGDRAPSENRA
jgi:hypothetical protein